MGEERRGVTPDLSSLVKERTVNGAAQIRDTKRRHFSRGLSCRVLHLAARGRGEEGETAQKSVLSWARKQA